MKSVLEERSTHELSDLLQYHDRAFVMNAYLAIAKESPDHNQLNETLHELRSGQRTKAEIVEDLVAKYPNARVDGLTSPAMRRISRWPLIGQSLKTLRAIARLPLLLQHQQQFESYIAGQHQQMSDQVNDVLATSTVAGNEISSRHAELQENVSDAIKTVMMLSDSLIEMSAQLAANEERLQTVQASSDKAEADLRKNLLELTEQVMTSVQHLQRQQEQQAASLQDLQKQHETSESQLHADLVALTNALSDARRAQEVAATAQREFLIDEQRAIVEAQRAALTDLQDQLNELSGSKIKKKGR